MIKPLENLTFCCTAVDPTIKKGLITKIKSLGGAHTTDLTSEADVLVVGERFTDKFTFCVYKRPDIKFVSPEAVSVIYEGWLNLEDNIKESLAAAIKFDDYLMPTFEGLKICLSRIATDEHIRSDQVEEIAKLIRENGGKVDSSLHNGCDCVITNEKSGKRYEKGREWGIKAIHPLWVLHSATRGATFPWSNYDIDNVKNLSSIGEDSLHAIKEISMLKDSTIFDAPQVDINAKSFLTIAPKKRSRIWDTIMEDSEAGNGANKRLKDNEWDEDLDGDENPVKQINSLSNSKLTKVLDNQQLKSKANLLLLQQQQQQQQESKHTQISSLFKDLTFKIQFFDSKQTEILKKVVTSYSGVVIDSETDILEPSYLIIPHNFLIDDLPPNIRSLLVPNQDSSNVRVATEWFIERSLHYNQLKYDTWTKPFYKRIKKCKTKLNVAISGFLGVELLHIKKLLGLLSDCLELSDYLNESRDLLIVNSDILHFKTSPAVELKYPDLVQSIPKSQVQLSSANSIKKKTKYAKEKNIPLVRVSFVFDFFKNEFGEIPAINGKEWCLFVPRGDNLKPTLQEYIDYIYHNRQDQNQQQKQTSNNKETNKTSNSIERPQLDHKPSLTASASSILPKLPSPLRNKQKDSGRLMGRAEVSQFDTIRSNNSDVSLSTKLINDENDESKGTQINYAFDDIVDGKSKSKVIKRSTRANTKEVMNLLD